MEIKNDKVILRDFIESDIEDRIYWETVETEWQLWDAPWEYDEEVSFDSHSYRKERLEWLIKPILIKQWNRKHLHSNLVRK